MSRRPGAGGITPPPPDPVAARRAAALILSISIGRGNHSAAAIRADARPVLDALGLLPGPASGAIPPAPEPRPKAPPAAYEPLPDMLTTRQAASIQKRLQRAGRPVPDRVRRLANDYKSGRRGGPA